MEKIVSVRFLRLRVADYVARVQGGEQFVICRHGRPIAVLRSRVDGERVVRVPVETFRSNLRRALVIARRRPVLLTWRGEPAAIVGPLPSDFAWEEWEL
jgi:prevent-host-death family protein